MSYIFKKECRMGGKPFIKGDKVPSTFNYFASVMEEAKEDKKASIKKEKALEEMSFDELQDEATYNGVDGSKLKSKKDLIEAIKAKKAESTEEDEEK